DLFRLATTSAFRDPQAITAPKTLIQKETISRTGPAKSLPELIYWPFRCRVICNGVVEVYRRTCCCQPWIINDSRIPELIRDLEHIIRGFPKVPPIPHPAPPDPPPFAETLFFKEGALDEMALNAYHDLAAIRALPATEVVNYINARPYLLCRRYSC